MLNLLFSLVTNSASSFCGTLEYILGDGGLSQFFLVGGGDEKYVPPNPPTHLILEQP
jgi:hypothetical protein